MFMDFPEEMVDVWPDDQKNIFFGDSLRSCLPDVGDPLGKCQRRMPSGVSIKPVVAVVRPPTVFGLIVEDFVRHVVNETSDLQGSLDVVATSHIDPHQHSYTMIVREVTIPVLLEAIDLALQTLDNTHIQQQITLEDVLGIVRLMVQWQCRLSQIAENTALLTMTSKWALSHPVVMKTELVAFLGSKIVPEKTGKVGPWMDANARRAFLRIDECSAVAQQLQRRHKHVDLRDLVDETIKSLYDRNGKCIVDDAGVELPRANRVLEIVRLLLDTESQSSRRVCETFPSIALCTS